MSEAHQGVIDQLQQIIVDRLTSDPRLAGIDVYYEKTKDIGSQIELALGTLKGICIVVTPPVSKSSKGNIPGPYFDDVTIDVNIPENPLLNEGATGTKKSSSYVAEIVAGRLQHTPTIHGRVLIATGILPVTDNGELRVYRVPVKTAFGLTASPIPNT
jgi:hypothetical protein